MPFAGQFGSSRIVVQLDERADRNARARMLRAQNFRQHALSRQQRLLRSRPVLLVHLASANVDPENCRQVVLCGQVVLCDGSRLLKRGFGLAPISVGGQDVAELVQ